MFTSKQFSISEEEYEMINKWDKDHDCIYKPKHGAEKYTGAIGGNLSITFMPTSIEELVKVTCDCGKELMVRDF